MEWPSEIVVPLMGPVMTIDLFFRFRDELKKTLPRARVTMAPSGALVVVDGQAMRYRGLTIGSGDTEARFIKWDSGGSEDGGGFSFG